MLQDLYKGFKKVNEDDSSATLEHENGHNLTIAKSGLNRQQIKALSKLPLHQAKGSEEEVKAPMAAPVDGSTQAKSVGANIASAVTQNILEGATQATTPQQSQYLSPEQIQQMPAPTATSVETGEPVAPAVGAEPEQIRGFGSTPLPPGPLTGFIPSGDMAPDEPGYKYAERKQKEYDEYTAQQQKISEAEKAQQKRLGGPGIFAALQPPEAQSEATPEQKGLASTEAGLATQAQQPTGAVTAPAQPAAQAEKPLAPAPLPSALRDPYQVLFDPTVSISERHQAGQIVYKGITDRIAKAEQDFQNKMANDEIDNDRVFNNMSTGRKIRTIIGVLLGAAGSGIGGGENLALAMLNKEIERDVEAQKSNRDSKFNLFKMHLEALNNERAATLQTMNNLRDNAELKMKDVLQSLDPKNLKEKAALEAIIAKSKLEKTKAHSEMAQLELENLWKQNELAGKAGAAGLEPQAVREKTFTITVPTSEGNLQTRRVRALNPENAQKAQARSAAIDKARDVLNRINNFNRTKGVALVSGEEIGEAEGLNTEMDAAIAEMIAGGISDKTIKVLQNIAPKAGAMAQAKQAGKAKSFAQTLTAETNKMIQEFKAR